MASRPQHPGGFRKHIERSGQVLNGYAAYNHIVVVVRERQGWVAVQIVDPVIGLYPINRYSADRIGVTVRCGQAAGRQEGKIPLERNPQRSSHRTAFRPELPESGQEAGRAKN
jgi:hypothetical protein